jgi:hypothetical protein
MRFMLAMVPAGRGRVKRAKTGARRTYNRDVRGLVIGLVLLAGCNAGLSGAKDAGTDGGARDLAVDLAGVDLAAVDLAGADLAGADLAGADLAAPDGAAEDLSAPDAAAGDLAAPDAGEADLAVPDAGEADLAVPDGAPVDGGGPAGDAAPDGSVSGDGGTCGNHVRDPGEMCCDALALARAIAGLPPYLVRRTTSSGCVAPSTTPGPLFIIDSCTGACGDGGIGCPYSLSARDAGFDGDAGVLTSLYDFTLTNQIQVASLFGTTTCTVASGASGADYTVHVTFSDHGTDYSATPFDGGLTNDTPSSTSTCGGAIFSAIASTLAAITEQQLRAVVLADGSLVVSSYSSACNY